MKQELPEPARPDSAEREYRRHLSTYVQTYIKLMRNGLGEIVPELRETAAREQPRMDENIESKLKRLFDNVQKRLEQIFPDVILRRWVFAMIALVNRHTKISTAKQFKTAYRRAGKEAPDFEPFFTDGKLSPYYHNVVDANVGLIRSIPLEKMPVFKNQLVAMITGDQSQVDIKKAIQKNFGVTRNKATLLARDQVGKLNGALEEHRQRQLGITHYIWRTSKDSRVRHDHKELEGTIQRWDKPPIVDKRTGRRAHPKRDYQCRCWAEPYFGNVLTI